MQSPRFRAIRWRSCSSDTHPVADWRATATDAIADALADYRPHSRVVYEIEGEDGSRHELADAAYDAAAEAYHDRIRNRDAVGVTA